MPEPLELAKRIVEAPSYEIDSIGIVRNIKTRKVIAWQVKGERYPLVSLQVGGKKVRFRVHVLVAKYFIGERPKGMVIRHLDGDSHNPSVSNLQYGTQKENEADKVRHGRTTEGEKHGQAKLTTEKVQYIRDLIKSNPLLNKTDLANQLSVHRSLIYLVATKKGWKHVA